MSWRCSIQVAWWYGFYDYPISSLGTGTLIQGKVITDLNNIMLNKNQIDSNYMP